MPKLAVALILVLVASVSLAQNVPVTEKRVDKPFEPDQATVLWLGEQIYANPWLSLPAEWNKSYPSPAWITTVYGRPRKGDSLTPVNDIPDSQTGMGQRPCLVHWKVRGVCGAAVEVGVEGNTIVSTFVITGAGKTVETVREVIVERTRTEYVLQPGDVKTVFINTGFYHPPAGLTQETGTNIAVPSGHAFYGPEEGQIVVGIKRTVEAKPQVCPPKPPPPPPPPGPTCPPGTPNPPPGPNNPGVNVPPHDPSTPTVPGGDPVPPGVGPPPPAPPDHGIITPGPGDPPTPPHMPYPDGPHQADPVDPSTL